MLTNDTSENNSEVNASEESFVKWEVKQEVEDTDSDVVDWNNFATSERDECFANEAIENENADVDSDSVKKEEVDENDEDIPVRQRITKGKSAPVSLKEDESDIEEEQNRSGSESVFRKKQKKQKDDDWNESMEYSHVSKKPKRSQRTRHSAKNRPSPPEVLDELHDDFEDSFQSNSEETGNERSDAEEGSARKKRKKKKDKEWDESDEYIVGRKRLDDSSSRTGGGKKCAQPKMPEIFVSMEEFRDYMENRLMSIISNAIKDDEDPRIHHHFYLALYECVQAGLRQGLVNNQEADDVWKKYDDLAGQKYESRERQSEGIKKKKKKIFNRMYVRVKRVRLKKNEYQDMVRKTRRLKTSVVRDYVLKSMEENSGENKIINDLKVRRDFFEMLLDVPGSDSRTAVLCSIRNLWKHLIYGKKEDWSKYLTNKERVLEKRKELMDPENVKMRRYLYRQAYVASLPKEEIERRSREKAAYFREKRKIMDEEKRKELREKNRQWRMNLTGEKREKYIERVYSAIRKRNERLKYERAGLKPPEELLPIRKGRYLNTAAKGSEQGSKSEIEMPTNCRERIGKGRGRGLRAPRKFGICHKKPVLSTEELPIDTTVSSIAPSPSAQVPPSATTTTIVSPQPLDLCDNLNLNSTCAPIQHQSIYHDLGKVPPLDYFSQNGIPQHSLSYQQHHQYHRDYLPSVSSVMSESNHSSVTSLPLSTPPHNYSIRDRSQQKIFQQEPPSEELNDNQQHDFEDDGDVSRSPSPPPNCPNDPKSNSSVQFPAASSTIVNAHSNRVDKSSKTVVLVSTPTPTSGTPEICEECGMQFARSYDLRKHITFAHGEDESNRKCPMCEKEFNLPRSLWRHIVRHHGGMGDANKPKVPKPTRVYHGPCKCELCGKEFLTGDMRKAYRDHMRRTHKAKQEKSAGGANTAMLLTKQSESLSNPPEWRPKSIRCELCGKEMLFISLKRHMRSVHPANETKSFACEECGKTFKDRRYLTDHVRLTHSFNFWKMIESRNILVTSYSKESPGKEIFTCTICSEIISEKLQFRTHVLKKHSDVFKEMTSSGAAYSNRECEVCKATFPKEIELREHLTTEHPELPWNCPHCAKFICSQTSLLKHIKNIHSKSRKPKEATNDEINGKKCPKCGDMIDGGETDMWMHIKAMHSEIIVYCKYCNKPKWSKRLLSDHQRICKLKPEMENDVEEESKNKVVCTVCGTKLKHQDSLNRHMKEVHKVHKTVFQCEEPACKEVFTNKTKLYNHLEEDHGNTVKRWRKKKTRCKETDKLLPLPPVQRRVSARKKP